MDPAKTDAIKEWKPPASLKEVQSFIVFANFYHWFIKDFAKLASPLTALTKKNIAFKWETPEQHLFESIKKVFSTTPILQHFDLEKECVVETDTSDYVSGAVLSQPDHEEVLCYNPGGTQSLYTHRKQQTGYWTEVPGSVTREPVT